MKSELFGTSTPVGRAIDKIINNVDYLINKGKINELSSIKNSNIDIFIEEENGDYTTYRLSPWVWKPTLEYGFYVVLYKNDYVFFVEAIIIDHKSKNIIFLELNGIDDNLVPNKKSKFKNIKNVLKKLNWSL